MNGVEPAWMLKTTFYWSQKFPDGKDVKIAHTYTPVSDEAAYSPLAENPKDVLANYSENYCLDGAVEKAVKKLNARREKMLNADKIPKFALVENWLEYILETGANWAGSIKHFRLVVDKGAKRNFVSFCGET